jgi:hypothetical protein
MDGFYDHLFGSQESDAHNPHMLPTMPAPIPHQGNVGEPEGPDPESSQAPPSSTTRELQSEIFTKHFRKGVYDRSTKKFTVHCNYCSNKTYQWKSGGGYGTMKTHMERTHPDKLGMMRGQTQLAGFATSSSNNPHLFTYNHETSMYAFSESICVDHLAFQFAESVGFNDWMTNHVQPAYQPISRKVIRKNVMKAYKKRKLALCRFFSENDIKVSICSDIWSDHFGMHSYMGLTCHFIDDHFIMQKRVLAYRVFDISHTAVNISNIIRTILEEYRLLRRVFSISFDNASNNTASIRELVSQCQPTLGTKYFHIRCACHILNLCVKDGLVVLHDLVEPIKYVVGRMWASQRTTNEWKAFCREKGVPARIFPKDVAHRWNSTYKLLHSCLSYKDLLSSFAAQYIPNSHNIVPVWDYCYKILEVLKVFNDATLTFSHVYEPCSHLFCVEALNVASAFYEGRKIPELYDAIEAMKLKWLNYYKVIPDIYLVACVFYPRFKLSGLEVLLNDYYESLELELNDNDCNVTQTISRVRVCIEELYKDYDCSSGGSSSPLPPSSSSSRPSFLGRGSSFLRNQTKRPRHSSSHAEFDTYLTTTFEFVEEGFDILDWWRLHKNTFPTLSKIAAQVLVVPASTVAVEQTFSQGGNILDERRSRLKPDALEAQVCVDDWKRAEIRQQKMNYTDTSSDGLLDDDSRNTSSAGSEGST